MKVFNRDNKMNFVDDRNVFVGFDYYQSCCESFGWVISEEVMNYDQIYRRPVVSEDVMDYPDYTFDTQFFERNSEGMDQGGLAVFKLTKDKSPDLYLHIWNDHNGYYSHGFEMKDGQNLIQQDNL